MPHIQSTLCRISYCLPKTSILVGSFTAGIIVIMLNVVCLCNWLEIINFMNLPDAAIFFSICQYISIFSVFAVSNSI